MHLSYNTAIAMLRSIEQYTPSDFDVLGISQEDFERLSSPRPWRREEMSRIMRTITCILFGTLEVQGVPKIVVPSEFVAAHVVACVHPGNRMIACIWLAQERQTGAGALELAQRHEQPSQYDPTSADHLFALVCLLTDTSEANMARDRFREKLGLRIEESERQIA